MMVIWKKTRRTLSILLLCLPILGAGQNGFFIQPGNQRADFHFEYINNFIILKVKMNGFIPLNFIYDTGAEHSIFTKKEFARLFNRQYDRTFKVMGSDMKTELTAYLVRDIPLTINDKLSAPSQDFLVLEEDYFNFDQHVGIPIHGILSGAIFSNYLVRLDYEKRRITLFDHDAKAFKPKGYRKIPVDIFRNKPYLDTQVRIQDNTSVPARLLLDTGAGLSMILYSSLHEELKPPENAIQGHIGIGLGGKLDGFTGRVKQLDFGESLDQKGVIAFFQNIDTTGKAKYLNERHGIMGNALLSRFHIVIDYFHSELFLKPNKYYKDEYSFDRSGLALIASGKSLNKYLVQNVLNNSPSQEEGIEIGDRLLSINRWPVAFMDLATVNRKLQKKAGKRILIKVKRGNKKIKKRIVLRDLI